MRVEEEEAQRGIERGKRGGEDESVAPLSSAAAQQAVGKQQRGPAQLCPEWGLSLALRLTTTRRSLGPPHRSVGDRRGRHARLNTPSPTHTHTVTRGHRHTGKRCSPPHLIGL